MRILWVSFDTALAAALCLATLAGCDDTQTCRVAGPIEVCGSARAAAELARWTSDRYPPPLGIVVEGGIAMVVEPRRVVTFDLGAATSLATLEPPAGSLLVAYASATDGVYVVAAVDADLLTSQPASWSVGRVRSDGLAVDWIVSSLLPLQRLAVADGVAYGIGCTVSTGPCFAQRIPLGSGGSTNVTLDVQPSRSSELAASAEGIDYVAGTGADAQLVRLSPTTLVATTSRHLAWTGTRTQNGVPSGPFRVGSNLYVGLTGLASPAGVAALPSVTLDPPLWLEDESGSNVAMGTTSIGGDAAALFLSCQRDTSTGASADPGTGIHRLDRTTGRIETLVRGSCPPFAVTTDALYVAATNVDCAPGPFGCDAARYETVLLRIPR